MQMKDSCGREYDRDLLSDILCSRYEVSCISIPQKGVGHELLKLTTSLADDSRQAVLLSEVKAGKLFVVGTHKPSVEVLSFLPEIGIKVLAVGAISLTNTSGTAIGGCVPQDVRLVVVDRFYIFSGLRNGMLLRFEWPIISAASQLGLSSQQPFTNSCLNKVDSSMSSSTASFPVGSKFSAVNVVESDSLSPALVVVDMRKEMVAYLIQQSETHVAETMIEEDFGMNRAGKLPLMVAAV